MAPAWAAPQVPTRLVWNGSICGTAADFAARVRARTSAVRFVQRGQRLAVRLRIESRGSGLDASVSIEERGHPPQRRHIESPDCEDALDALALVVAIGVESRSASVSSTPPPVARRRARQVTPPSEAPVEPAPEPAAPPPADEPAVVEEPAAPEPVAPAPEPTPSALPEVPVVVAPPAARPPAVDIIPIAPSSPASRFHLAAGLSAQMSLGIAPDPLSGGALWIATRWQANELWSPELIVSVLHQRLDGWALDGGRVDFALTGVALSLCPLRLGLGPVQVQPCAGSTLGRLVSEGRDTYDPSSRNRPWGAFGGSLELLAALGIVELRASFGASAPFVRDGFRFGAACAGSACEADVFHRVAPVIWSGAAGAGIRFW